MRLPQMTTRGLLLVVACTAVALAAYPALQHKELEGSPIVGLLSVVACVACAAAVGTAIRLRSGSSGARYKVLLRSLSDAVVMIGVPDAAFVATYLLLSGGRWYVVPFLHEPRVLNRDGVIVGATVAVGVASLLRQRFWLSCRKARPKDAPDRCESAMAQV